MKQLLLALLIIVVITNVCLLVFLHDQRVFLPPYDTSSVEKFISAEEDTNNGSRAYGYIKMFIHREVAQYHHYRNVRQFILIFPAVSLFVSATVMFFICTSSIRRKCYDCELAEETTESVNAYSSTKEICTKDTDGND